MLDYGYVIYWQAHGLLFPINPSKYLAGSGQPVVLLPGIHETWQFMRPVAESMHERGHPVHVVTGLGRNRGTVVDAARIAAGYLTSHDLTNVIIVAHSKGGLIGKYLMMAADVQGRIERMIAIACPFAGSSLARYTGLPSLRAFSPTDPTIQLLGEEQFVNARITSIFGVFDPHIPGGSELPGATNVRLPVAVHFRLMGDLRLHRAVDAACGA